MELALSSVEKACALHLTSFNVCTLIDNSYMCTYEAISMQLL